MVLNPLKQLVSMHALSLRVEYLYRFPLLRLLLHTICTGPSSRPLVNIDHVARILRLKINASVRFSRLGLGGD